MVIGIDASRATSEQRTGTEAYACHLIQELIPLVVTKGYWIRLYFNQPPPPGLLLPAAHVEPVVIPFPRLWTHLRLARELHQRPPDVFFTPAHVIPLTYFGRSVATVHDLGYHTFPQAHTWSQLAYLRWSTRHNSRRSQRIIADSQTTRADLVRFYAIDRAKIDVIYPGVDPELKPVTNQDRLKAVQEKYGVTPPYLLYIGTLQPRKNLVRLVQAYAASNVQHQLVLAGKAGWLAQPILDTISNLQSFGFAQGKSPISNLIRLPGFVHDDDKAALISGATALLYPSLYEGFGFPVLEAQSCGTAVLCANSSSLTEVAGAAALMVDPLDTVAMTAAIQRLASDEPLRQQLIEKGFENVKRFNWQKTAAQALATLERAAG
ncbi:MAG TPA: glycosyltransferase family 1 protein [Anaerolineae bacterium]